MVFKSWALAAVGLLLLCCGCIPQSLHPLFTDSDYLYNPLLEGAWGPLQEADVWCFSQLNDFSYTLKYSEEGRPAATFTGQVTQLGDSIFLDVSPAQPNDQNSLWSLTHVPVHGFWKIELVGDSLLFTGIDTDRLNKYLAEHPDELKYEEQEGGMQGAPLITAPTAEVRDFVARHMGDEGFFVDPLELKRKAQ